MDEVRSSRSASSGPSTPLSFYVYENRDNLASLQARVLHLEERLHSAENQIEANNRRLTWLEQFSQKLRGLASQLC